MNKLGVIMRNEDPQEPMEERTKSFCFKCNLPYCECPQEPMEWAKEFYKLAKELNLRVETVSGFDEIGVLQNFISLLIKQAEERVLNELREVVKDDEDGRDTLEEIIISRKILN